MSRSLNKVTLIGNVGADPEVRSTTGGNRVATFSLATSRTWNGPSVPPEVEQAIDKRSSMAAVGNLNDYVKFQMAQGMAAPGGGGNAGGFATEMAVGTLACPECDAPVVPAGTLRPADPVHCIRPDVLTATASRFGKRGKLSNISRSTGRSAPSMSSGLAVGRSSIPPA